MYFVFSFVTNQVTKGTGLVGIRDTENFSNRRLAQRRLNALKKMPQTVPIRQRTIRSEQW